MYSDRLKQRISSSSRFDASDSFSGVSFSSLLRKSNLSGVAQTPLSGQLYSSSSLQRLNVTDKPTSLYKSNYDLSSPFLPSSSSYTSPSSRTPRQNAFQRYRPSSVDHYRYHSRSVTSLSSLLNSSDPFGYTSTSPNMEKRELIISHYNLNLPHAPNHSPKVPRRNRIRPNYTSRPSWSKYHITPSRYDYYRPRIKERPNLAVIRKSIKIKQTRRMSEADNSSELVEDESQTGLSRFRHVIKFREHHIGEPVYTRKTSISWDLPPVSLPSSASSSVKTNKMSPLMDVIEEGTALITSPSTSSKLAVASEDNHQSADSLRIEKVSKSDKSKRKLEDVIKSSQLINQDSNKLEGGQNDVSLNESCKQLKLDSEDSEINDANAGQGKVKKMEKTKKSISKNKKIGQTTNKDDKISEKDLASKLAQKIITEAEADVPLAKKNKAEVKKAPVGKKTSVSISQVHEKPEVQDTLNEKMPNNQQLTVKSATKKASFIKVTVDSVINEANDLKPNQIQNVTQDKATVETLDPKKSKSLKVVSNDKTVADNKVISKSTKAKLVESDMNQNFQNFRTKDDHQSVSKLAEDKVSESTLTKSKTSKSKIKANHLTAEEDESQNFENKLVNKKTSLSKPKTETLDSKRDLSKSPEPKIYNSNQALEVKSDNKGSGQQKVASLKVKLSDKSEAEAISSKAKMTEGKSNKDQPQDVQSKTKSTEKITSSLQPKSKAESEDAKRDLFKSPKLEMDNLKLSETIPAKAKSPEPKVDNLKAQSHVLETKVENKGSGEEKVPSVKVQLNNKSLHIDRKSAKGKVNEVKTNEEKLQDVLLKVRPTEKSASSLQPKSKAELMDAKRSASKSPELKVDNLQTKDAKSPIAAVDKKALLPKTLEDKTNDLKDNESQAKALEAPKVEKKPTKSKALKSEPAAEEVKALSKKLKDKSIIDGVYKSKDEDIKGKLEALGDKVKVASPTEEGLLLQPAKDKAANDKKMNDLKVVNDTKTETPKKLKSKDETKSGAKKKEIDKSSESVQPQRVADQLKDLKLNDEKEKSEVSKKTPSKGKKVKQSNQAVDKTMENNRLPVLEQNGGQIELDKLTNHKPIEEEKDSLAVIENELNELSQKQDPMDRSIDSKSKEKPVEEMPEKSVKKRIRFRKYDLDDFDLIKVLGRGSFGKVFLAELKQHNVYYAIKCLKKHVVVEDDDVESTMIERKVLALGSHHPFICKLFCTFQTLNCICFVMEFLVGGDLMFHIQKCGKFTEDRAIFYAAEVVCALKFLHNKYIIYRDLKLDNILLDHLGHIRLVDFGMCQCYIYKEECLPSNFCGTPEYMAPEIIKGVQYNQAVDWWSFGVLVYEMLVGISPFKGADEDELLWNVCYQSVNYPDEMSEASKNLVSLLLDRDPGTRLGMPSSPAGSLTEHQFFSSVNWRKAEKCQLKPPFVPIMKHPADTSYFDKEFTNMAPIFTPIDQSVAESLDHELFVGFEYTNPNMTD